MANAATSERIIFISEVIGVIVGIASAVLWFWASEVKTPTTFQIPTSLGFSTSPDLDTLGKQLAWQSELNAWAALAAGIAVVLTAVVPKAVQFWQRRRR